MHNKNGKERGGVLNNFVQTGYQVEGEGSEVIQLIDRGLIERNDTFNDKQSKNRRAKNWGATGARKKRGKKRHKTKKSKANELVSEI